MGVMSGTAKVVLLCCTISGFVAVNIHAQNNNESGLKLTVIAPPSPFRLGDKMWLDIMLTNTSAEPVTMLSPPGPDVGERSFRVDLVGSDGKAVPRWKDLYPKAPGSKNIESGSIAMMVLQPGAVAKRQVHLRTRFKIETAGTYSIRVLFVDSAKHLQSVSNSVTFEVLPTS